MPEGIPESDPVAGLPEIARWILFHALHRALLSLCIYLLAGWTAVALAEDPLQKETEEFFPLALNGTLRAENADGSIHIYGWSEPRLRLAALRKAYTEPRLQQIRVETKVEAAGLSVRTIIPKASGFFADRSGTIDYTLTVPESARLRLKLVNGEITLENLRGANVDLELMNGRVTALNCYAQIRARARNGIMEAFFEWWKNLPTSYDYVLEHGRIGVRLPGNASFRVNARTGNGWVHHEFQLPSATNAGRGQTLEAATAPDAPLSLGLSTGGGNISIDRSADER